MANWSDLEKELDGIPVDKENILSEKVRKTPEPTYEKPRKESEYDPDGVAYKTPIPPAQPAIPKGHPAPPPRRHDYK